MHLLGTIMGIDKMKIKIFHGQKIEYDEEKRLVKTSIQEPFWTASKKLGWKIKSAGLGFNTDILDFIISNKYNLQVMVESANHEYIIPYETLKNFIDNNHTYYHKTGVDLGVIPWRLFKSNISQEPTTNGNLGDFFE